MFGCLNLAFQVLNNLIILEVQKCPIITFVKMTWREPMGKMFGTPHNRTWTFSKRIKGVCSSMCRFAWQQKTEAVGPSSNNRLPALLWSVQGRPAVSKSVLVPNNGHNFRCEKHHWCDTNGASAILWNFTLKGSLDSKVPGGMHPSTSPKMQGGLTGAPTTFAHQATWSLISWWHPVLHSSVSNTKPGRVEFHILYK